jgi:hypothetical protein
VATCKDKGGGLIVVRLLADNVPIDVTLDEDRSLPLVDVVPGDITAAAVNVVAATSVDAYLTAASLLRLYRLNRQALIVRLILNCHPTLAQSHLDAAHLGVDILDTAGNIRRHLLLKERSQRAAMRREEVELLGDGFLVEHTRLVGGDGMRVASHDGV